MKATSRKKYIRALRTFAIYGMLGLLLWWALRTVPLNEIWNALKQLKILANWRFALAQCACARCYDGSLVGHLAC